MSDINLLPDETFCMRSEIVNHDRKFEWIIAGVSKFKLLSPYNITCKEFKLSPDCKFRWELYIELYIESMAIKISRKDELGDQVRISSFVSFRNSEGETYDPIMPGCPIAFYGHEPSKQLFYCKMTKDFPLKLPNDELTVKIHLKMTNCCLITKEIKDAELETASGENELSRDLLQVWQSKYLDMQPTDVFLEVGNTLLPCHKFILSVRSSFFKKMLEDGKLERNSVVKFEDVDSEVCRGFMAYIYTNEISDLSPDAVLELYNVSVKYQIDGLQEKCSLMLTESLAEKNVYKALKLADQHNDVNLKTASATFILGHMEKLKNSPELSIFLKDDPLLFFRMLSSSFGVKK